MIMRPITAQFEVTQDGDTWHARGMGIDIEADAPSFEELEARLKPMVLERLGYDATLLDQVCIFTTGYIPVDEPRGLARKNTCRPDDTYYAC